MADFSNDLEDKTNLEVQQLDEPKDSWALFTGGSSNARRTALGVLLKSPQGDITTL